jgi:sugar O-acyltransferase (sialic acid O-acetyltransferase NeuD family)
MNNLILVGGGGHCRSCIDIIELTKLWNIVGIIDLPSMAGKTVYGYLFIGSDDDLEKLAAVKSNYFLITLGQIKDPYGRQKLYGKIKSYNGNLPVVCSAHASVSSRAVVDEGTVIMNSAIVGTGVHIGSNCIINTRAILEHDSRVGSHSHISTNAVVNGDVQIGSSCLVGSGAVISNGVTICSNAIIGAGAVVIRDIAETGTYVGNPARKVA